MEWKKSEDGFTQTKDGRYEIEPVYAGRIYPIAFRLYFKRQLIRHYADTQREAKRAAEWHDATIRKNILAFTRQMESDLGLVRGSLNPPDIF